MEPGSEQLGLMTGLVLGIGSARDGALGAGLRPAGPPRVPPGSLLLASLACGCLTLPLLAVMGTFWQFVAARVVMGLLTGGIVTLAYAHVSTILPSDRLSVSFSMFASVAMVASAVGPVSMSTLATTAGLRSPLLVGRGRVRPLLRRCCWRRPDALADGRAQRQDELPAAAESPRRRRVTAGAPACRASHRTAPTGARSARNRCVTAQPDRELTATPETTIVIGAQSTQDTV